MKKRTRALAAVGIAAVGAMSLFGATAAMAVPDDFGNIDGGLEGSLTVHKFLHQSGAHEGDISEPPADGDFTDPVADVEFTVYPLIKDGETLPLNLTVAANWNSLSTLAPGANCTAPTGFSLGTPIVMPLTDADGVSTTSLVVGAYQVCETDAPAAIVDTAAPFIVTVPMPYENGWVYDVNAYPKNGAAAIEKTIVAQEGLGLGAAVQFPVTTAIPTMLGQAWTAYSISDTFDPRLDVNAATEGIASVTVDGVDLDASYYTKIVTGQEVVMDFTAAGIAWLNEGTHAGSVIEVVFDSVIAEVGSGTIENQALLWTNNPTRDDEVKPPPPSNIVHTNWGSLELMKRASGTTNADGALEGAVFEIYKATDPYAADCTAETATGDPISVGGVAEFTSDANGIVAFPGLFVSDSENPAIDAPERCYVVKEIAAPAGYVLPANGAEYTGVAVQIGETTAADNLEIQNTQQGVPSLPLTGGSGTAILIGLGVGGVGVALGLVLMKKRRRDQAESSTHSAA
ncbi:SpaH/EbpB family LPXTG-anchored major pilin [Microbacterium sp. A204]|uniref:SpaH/EbpB family LPXTG-anchored major pilin n=1 Tax=Microbacterium sp. A204 TaxID=3457321 RepID=UPI003FD21405